MNHRAGKANHRVSLGGWFGPLRSGNIGVWLLGTFILLMASATFSSASEVSLFGFAKVEITPEEPLRLSGYGNRTVPFEGIDEPLWARAMAFTWRSAPGGESGTYVLVSVDTIGLPGSLVAELAQRVEQQHGIPRERFVVCFTHAHTAPHIARGLTNIFAKPLTEKEARGSERYRELLAERVVQGVRQAIEDMRPAGLLLTEGQVRFAENRRVLQDGKWAGFGVNPDGPVDFSLPMLRIVDATNEKVMGIVFNYACHCTTFDSDHNRINGDWAGYATQYVEQQFPGACALCTIGCGADANPPRDRAKARQFAQAEGREIAQEVQRLSASDMQPITAPLAASFTTVDLMFDLPALDQLKQQLESPIPQVRQHAHDLLAIHAKSGALPASYPAPIQIWQFGDQLAMIFLSGEVVVDYALRLKRELAPRKLWVSGYSNDLFAYVASERMRAEGGYEVDSSMIFYSQPGPWASGTEERIVRHIRQILATSPGARERQLR